MDTLVFFFLTLPIPCAHRTTTTSLALPLPPVSLLIAHPHSHLIPDGGEKIGLLALAIGTAQPDIPNFDFLHVLSSILIIPFFEHLHSKSD